ncbi:MAG: glycosyltransferase [Clostridia bacterium]|nr:glycosyltransferase [Clostridia bacterium]
MNSNCVTVIVPARNEEKTIVKVVDLIKLNKNVNQIIVVDNNSTDNTSKLAKDAGAEVVFCANQGKGYAMEKGMQYVKNDIVVFLDADIADYSRDVIDILIKPVLKDEFDFVKSMFERTGGRVTELVAKPLLEITYPEIYKFSQPLSGMIAGKTEFFKKIEFEKDYGVDIGILLDMLELNARITEVGIGRIENASQDWKLLDKMAKEVMTAILKRRYK